MNARQLQQKIINGIPLTKHMGFEVQTLEDNAIQVIGRLEDNINVHGTAFAGSLYTLCTLALWGLVTSRLPEKASLVLADASIRYLKPVNQDIVAQCHIDPRVLDEFLTRLQQRGKARLQASVRIAGKTVDAVAYEGIVYARLPETS